MPDFTLLCGKRNNPDAVTVGLYKRWLLEQDHGWSKKPSFIQRRLCERYIDPVQALNANKELKTKKHGFYVMAVSCLLIETLVSFWRGWESTEPCRGVRRYIPGKSRRGFELFFRVQPRFKSLRGKAFYKRVRCGILHQGETTGGWTIERTGALYDGKKRINATKFHDELAGAIKDYVVELKKPDSPLRAYFDKKMKAVISNCE